MNSWYRILCGLCLLASQLSASLIVSVNFNGDGSASRTLLPSEITGVVAVNNWNNASNSGFPAAGVVVDSEGTALPGGLSFTWSGGQANDSGSTLALFNGGIWMGSSSGSLNISTGSSVFATQNFSLYVYATTPGNNLTTEGTRIRVDGVDQFVRGNQAVDHDRFVVGGGPSLTDAATASNYVSFHNLRGDTTVDLSAVGGGRVALKGIQLVAVPEPGTLLLLGLGSILLLRRRG